MTTKPPSRLAASGPLDDLDTSQITKEHNDDDPAQDITVDPSGDVTVEATEDVTIEAGTPHPLVRPNADGGTPRPVVGQRAPTLLGVPIHSLPLPGLTSSAANEDATRSISYDEEITVLAPPSPADPLAVLDALDRPSITDDDEEETKVEPAEAAMKAAESMDDVTTALSAQASLEREKALRRSAPPAASADDLEFADPEADEEQQELQQELQDEQQEQQELQEEEEESLDDELDDDDEVISAGGAIEEEEDDDGSTDGVATATFMKPADSTGLSGLLSPRRPPTGNPYGRDGFGARLPTPYPPPQTTLPAPAISPFASRLGPAPAGSSYAARPTGAAIPAIQVPPPSGKATTETEPGFFQKLKAPVPVPRFGLIALVGGSIVAGFGFGSWLKTKAVPATPTVIVAKPTAPPAPPVVEPVVPGGTTAATAEPKPKTPPPSPAEATAVKPAAPAPTVTDMPGSVPGEKPSETAEAALWKPTKKPATPKPHKQLASADSSDDGLPKAATPKPAVSTAKPPTPKPAVSTTPKPPAAKPGKKPAKAWVDPFAN
jgi:hypothetical protein